MRNSNYIFPFLLFIPLLIIQLTLVPLISIRGFVPDLILILLVFYTLQSGQIYGTVLGFIFGFLYDLVTGSLIGSMMFAKTAAGFTAGYFANENKIETYFKSYSFTLIVLLCAVIDSLLYSIFSSKEFTFNILLLFFEQGLLPGIYTAIISFIVVFFYPKRSFS
ncbi:MAG: rod shape-determining protein MreD [Syntrophothermus sp.]